MFALRSLLLSPLLLIGILLIAGCSSPYDPPVQGDHAGDKYKKDLEACRTSSSHAVYIRNADNPWSWMASPFTGPPEVRTAIRSCMRDKGYALENAPG